MEYHDIANHTQEVDVGSYVPGSSRLSIANVPIDDKQNPLCHECQQPIHTSQFIRAGSYSFHKEHFSCFVCKKLLHDQKPRFKDGHFYCNDDFRNKFCHTCNKCGEKIVEGSVVRALGKYYHQHHFVCTLCDAPFSDGKYYDIDGRPYCSEHYTERQLEICAKCSKPIQDIDVVTLNGSSYHVSCLKCSQCSIPLAGKGSIFQKQGQVYCRDDYLNLFSKTCTACGKHIVKQILAVNDEFYHPDCLKCHFCNVPLAQYIASQGYLRCERHFETEAPKIMCTVCSEPIVDEDPVLSAGHKVHARCFHCNFCGVQLQKAETKRKDGRLCCPGCLMGFPRSDNAFRPSFSAQSSTSSPSMSTAGIPSGPGYSTAPAPYVTSNLTPTNPSTSYAPSNASLSQPPTPYHTATVYSSSPASSNGYSPSAQQDSRASSSTPTGVSLMTSAPQIAASNNVHSPIPSGSPVSPAAPPTGGSNAAAAAAAGDPNNSVGNTSNLLDNEFSNCNIMWKRGDVIGKGSFGKVFLGMNSNTGELLAIKQIPIKENLDLEIQQIVTEIKLMEKLRHPNIVTLLGTQRTGNKLNIIMEYVAGNSIDNLLAKFGPFAENVMQSYTRQLLDALAYCHTNGVVHRDLKGKNVLVDTNGNLKLADFGSAKRFQDVLMKDSPSLGYNYTPLWTAPEVLTGDYNSKVDIWSLGCVVIEMATAKSPWHECNFEHAFRALNHIASSNDIPRIPNNLSPEGRDFLLMCLKRNPDERPTATELLSHRWVAKREA